MPRTWLLLTHHLPAEPAYLRVKVRRRLDRLGAVPLKNSVYVLPLSDEALEDFQWLRQEIEREGGEAFLAESRFLNEGTEDRLVRAFRTAREGDYADIVAAARDLRDSLTRDGEGGDRDSARSRVAKLTKRLEEVTAMDYFEAPGSVEAQEAVAAVRRVASAAPDRMTSEEGPSAVAAPPRGRTWVTRAGVRVDRIASAWLIRRFIDPEAVFAFVDAGTYVHAPGELRFDMFEGEFTHEGDACTFETLLRAFSLDDPALAAIGQIVHDIDCKDDAFGRPETRGFASLIDGMERRHDADEDRLEDGAALLDGFHAHFRAVGG